MEKKAKQGIMWYSADLASFLFKCAWKTLVFGVPCRNITTMCRNIAFIEVRAEILLTWDQGVPGFSCRANFGVREEILIFRRNIHLWVRANKFKFPKTMITKYCFPNLHWILVKAFEVEDCEFVPVHHQQVITKNGQTEDFCLKWGPNEDHFCCWFFQCSTDLWYFHFLSVSV